MANDTPIVFPYIQTISRRKQYMENSSSVRFLYGTVPGRGILKTIQCLHLDRIAVWFLCSPLSKPVIPRYIRNNQIPMEGYRQQNYRTFRDFFLREKKEYHYDMEATHLISPCDGWLSAFPIGEDQGFRIKGSYYKVSDLIDDPQTAAQFAGGQCLIFRLCASDYHHYCFIDQGTIRKSRYIEGQLHSVQPIACEKFPVFSLNVRLWFVLVNSFFGNFVV